MSKSEMIRQMIRSNPNMKASECVKAMRKQGTTITEGLFYNAKASMGKCASCTRNPCICVVPIKKTIEGDRRDETLDTIKKIVYVNKFAKEFGGLKQLAELIEAIRM